MNRSDHCNVHYHLPHDTYMCHIERAYVSVRKARKYEYSGKQKSDRRVKGLRRETTKTCV